MTTRKIMVVPCTVKTASYPAGSRNVFRGTASCTRISSASTPPSTKKPRLVSRYRSPMSLWSTVVTHRNNPVGLNPSTAGAGNGEATLATQHSSHLLQTLEIVDQRGQVGGGEILEGGHQHPGLQGLRVPNPLREVRRGVVDDAGADRRAAGEVGEIGADCPRGARQATNRVAGHAGVLHKNLLTPRASRNHRLALRRHPGGERIGRLGDH